MASLFRILAIDGGGIRGIIPASVLIEVERKLSNISGKEARIADYFDLLAGTSTGGILTCVYLCPDPTNPTRPRFSAEKARELYFERADEIFHIPVWHRTKSAGGILDEKYPAAGLEDALNDYVGDLKLSSLLKPCLIPAYDIKRRRSHFFTQHDAVKDPDKNFLVRDVARATSAAPTFFECALTKSDASFTYPLVDGGVFANNPTLCAYAEAHAKFGKRASDMAILSLGTGSFEKPYAWQEAKDWGLAGWAKPVIDIMMTGVSETVDYQLQQMFTAVGKPGQYLRIQPSIPASNAEMDNVDRENLNELREAGMDIAREKSAEIDQFLKLLV